ncbi:MAG TPA: hypothetical protein VGR20_06815 [Acidimicrobiia bacterium]|nr:hypothetical protein [Acidimicrobiia bacterium]
MAPVVEVVTREVVAVVAAEVVAVVAGLVVAVVAVAGRLVVVVVADGAVVAVVAVVPVEREPVEPVVAVVVVVLFFDARGPDEDVVALAASAWLPAGPGSATAIPPPKDRAPTISSAPVPARAWLVRLRWSISNASS